MACIRQIFWTVPSGTIWTLEALRRDASKWHIWGATLLSIELAARSVDGQPAHFPPKWRIWTYVLSHRREPWRPERRPAGPHGHLSHCLENGYPFGLLPRRCAHQR